MQTTERVKVFVDLNRVAQNLRAPGGTPVNQTTAISFMKYAGFDQANDGSWIGPRQQLRQFNPGEVLGVEPA